jgi:hypothetical protein
MEGISGGQAPQATDGVRYDPLPFPAR